jgi:hypothetical protein
MELRQRALSVVLTLGLLSSCTAATLLVMLTPSPAFAKGPNKAVVSGPGLTHPITLTSDEVPFIFFMSRPGRNALLPRRPGGPLGPRYTVTYPAVWGAHSGKVIQYVFPYARPRPVTYTPPNQRPMPLLPGYTWEAAHRSFAGTFLRALGLPTTQPRHAPNAVSRTRPVPRGSMPLRVFAGVAVPLVLGVGFLIYRRRRHRSGDVRRVRIAS